jgi:hypothetical protein
MMHGPPAPQPAVSAYSEEEEVELLEPEEIASRGGAKRARTSGGGGGETETRCAGACIACTSCPCLPACPAGCACWKPLLRRRPARLPG